MAFFDRSLGLEDRGYGDNYMPTEKHDIREA
jgi:hypothetical protein